MDELLCLIDREIYTQGYKEQNGGRPIIEANAQFLSYQLHRRKDALFPAHVSLTLLDYGLCLSIRMKLRTLFCSLVILNTLSGLKRQGHLKCCFSQYLFL